MTLTFNTPDTYMICYRLHGGTSVWGRVGVGLLAVEDNQCAQNELRNMPTTTMQFALRMGSLKALNAKETGAIKTVTTNKVGGVCGGFGTQTCNADSDIFVICDLINQGASASRRMLT